MTMVISGCLLPEITVVVKCVAKTTDRVSLMDGRGTSLGSCIGLCVSSTNKDMIKYENEFLFLKKYLYFVQTG